MIVTATSVAVGWLAKLAAKCLVVFGVFAKGVSWRASEAISVSFSSNGNATIGSGPLWISDGNYEVVSVAEVHQVLGTDPGAVSVDIKKVTGTQSDATGLSMLASTFSLKSAINTVVRKDRSSGGLAAARTSCQLAKGDRVSVTYAGVLTAVAGHAITIVMQPITKKPVW